MRSISTQDSRGLCPKREDVNIQMGRCKINKLCIKMTYHYYLTSYAFKCYEVHCILEILSLSKHTISEMAFSWS